MNVTTEEIRGIRPGTIVPFQCEDALALNSACSLVTRLKKVGMPAGVVNYETQKYYDRNIIIIHAMREGDEFVLNK